MCREFLKYEDVYGVYFYILNREVVIIEIFRRFGMWVEEFCKFLLWKQIVNYVRCKEDVRLIFWRFRLKSYIYRILNWDEFLNGRWGNFLVVSFGDFIDYYLFYLKYKILKEDFFKMWGEELNSE